MGFSTRYLSTAAAVLFVVAATACLPAGALAQAKRQPSLFQGFSGTSDQPINITSENLEADQSDQKVVFTGNVVATQGDTVLRSRQLTVFYEGTGEPAAGAQPGPDNGAKSVKRLEAVGAVTVTSADQKAASDTGTFDMKANTALLTGRVVLTQGRNVVRGRQLRAYLNTNIVRLTGGVHAHFVQDQPPGRGPAQNRVKRKQRRAVPLS